MRSHLAILTITLSIIGLGIFLYKYYVLHFPISPYSTAPVWTVEARLSLWAQDKPIKAKLFIPKNTSRYLLADENFISRGFGFSIELNDNNREALWAVRRASGRQDLYYRAVVREIALTEKPKAFKQPQIVSPGFVDSYLQAADSVLAEVRTRSADTESLVKELITLLNHDTPSDSVKLLLGKKPSDLKRVETAVKLLAHAQVAARVVHGINLRTPAQKAQFLHWLEVFENKNWKAFDPELGSPNVSGDFLPWWVGTEPLASASGAGRVEWNVSSEVRYEEAIDSALAGAEHSTPLLLKYSLFSLPIQLRILYRVLLMIPIGALMVVIFRNIVGIKTFGTFMPVLISLAFRETELVWGVILFSLIVGLGLMVRFYLEQLKLLLVPRLASVLTVVVLLMAFVSIVSHGLGLGLGLSVALFPMVIITMTIERMSIVWEELGAKEALKQALGTLLVAVMTYLIIRTGELAHIVFVFPELLLLVLASCLLLGRYTGYRLMELSRFKDLTRAKSGSV